jgi:hypothetical protein
MTVELEIFMHIWSRFRISNISDIKSEMRINSRQAARREPRRTQRCIKLEKKTKRKRVCLRSGNTESHEHKRTVGTEGTSNEAIMEKSSKDGLWK